MWLPNITIVNIIEIIEEFKKNLSKKHLMFYYLNQCLLIINNEQLKTECSSGHDEPYYISEWITRFYFNSYEMLSQYPTYIPFLPKNV